MNRTHILLVEDEPNIARGILFNLEEEGYAVTHVLTGEDALEQLQANRFDLVVLDVMLPGMDGLEVCRKLRKNDDRLPVLMLTARSEERDRINGLSHGADDYLTKPFSLDEFLLRVKGMLRRSEWYQRPEETEGFSFGANQVNLKTHRANATQGEFTLTDLELRILGAFFRNEGKVVSRAELLRSAWGMAPDAETRTLDNFIVRLRRYFEPDPANPIHFLTVRGRGYRFVRTPSKD